MYYMLFCCGVIFLLAVIIGFRRGLLGSLLRVVSLIIAVVATMGFAPRGVDLLDEKTDLDERIYRLLLQKRPSIFSERERIVLLRWK